MASREANFKLRAVLFDLDGVLADTEPLHFRAYREAFHRVGHEFTERAHELHWVRRGGTLSEYIKQHEIPAAVSDIRAAKNRRLLELIETEDIVVAGAVELLKTLRPRYKIAVCTSSRKETAQAVLRRTSLLDYVDVLVTAEDVAARKPAPDIFLEAARRLAVRPSECIVIEDALKGARAAEAAKMHFLIVCAGRNAVPGFAMSVGQLSVTEIEKAFERGQHA